MKNDERGSFVEEESRDSHPRFPILKWSLHRTDIALDVRPVGKFDRVSGCVTGINERGRGMTMRDSSDRYRSSETIVCCIFSVRKRIAFHKDIQIQVVDRDVFRFRF